MLGTPLARHREPWETIAGQKKRQIPVNGSVCKRVGFLNIFGPNQTMCVPAAGRNHHIFDCISDLRSYSEQQQLDFYLHHDIHHHRLNYFQSTNKCYKIINHYIHASYLSALDFLQFSSLKYPVLIILKIMTANWARAVN